MSKVTLQKGKTSFAEKHPNYAKEWHPNKNDNIKPNDVSYGSSRRVWWLCKEGHSYIMMVNNRNKGKGCRTCDQNKKILPEKSLKYTSPAIADEWHPTKNGSLTPLDIPKYYYKKVWWQCKKYKDHVWDATPANRHKRQLGCDFCEKRKASKLYSLQSEYPEIAGEWHPDKNGDLKPCDILPGSSNKVWWVCKKGHEWFVCPGNRTSGRTGCSKCQVSKSEVLIFECIRFIFPSAYKYKDGKFELDIFVNKENFQKDNNIYFAIEVDGYYHTKKEQMKIDKNKNDECKSRNIELFRYRYRNLDKLGKYDVLDGNGSGLDVQKVLVLIDNIFKWINTVKDDIPQEYKDRYHKIKNDKDTVNNIKKECDYYQNDHIPFFKLHTHLRDEWHEKKNKYKDPNAFSSGSNVKVWWQCKNHKDHEWRATIYSRTIGSQCPFCINQRACKDNCLRTLLPLLAKEWHPTKNGDLTPDDVVPGSNIRVWWKCENDHEWETTVTNRKGGSKCRHCPRGTRKKMAY